MLASVDTNGGGLYDQSQARGSMGACRWSGTVSAEHRVRHHPGTDRRAVPVALHGNRHPLRARGLREAAPFGDLTRRKTKAVAYATAFLLISFASTSADT